MAYERNTAGVQLIRIMRETCPACLLMKEIMRRNLPDYPDIRVVDLDETLDEEEAKAYPHQGVPFLQCGSHTLRGAVTKASLRAFLDECMRDKDQYEEDMKK
ncbi:MAG: hypothetical protein CW338_09950 [Clostridiales bacterium]|nr:hypothetical protein [Clostridiales bacterium]